MYFRDVESFIVSAQAYIIVAYWYFGNICLLVFCCIIQAVDSVPAYNHHDHGEQTHIPDWVSIYFIELLLHLFI